MKTLWFWMDGILALSFFLLAAADLWQHKSKSAWLYLLLSLCFGRCQAYELRERERAVAGATQ